MRTVQPIPYRRLRGPNGETASLYGAYPLGYVVETAGYTWRVVDGFGSVTIGLCRVPVATIEEAVAIATKVADQRGYTYLPPENNS